MKPSTYDRFSPSRVTVEVTPRCTQSGETDVIFGTGWEWAKRAWKNATRKAHRRREASHASTHPRPVTEEAFHERRHSLTPSLSPSGGEGVRRTGEGDSERFKVPRHGTKEVVGIFQERSSRRCEAAADVDVKSAAASPRRLPLIAGRFLGERKCNTLSPSNRRSNQTAPAPARPGPVHAAD